MSWICKAPYRDLSCCFRELGEQHGDEIVQASVRFNTALESNFGPRVITATRMGMGMGMGMGVSTLLRSVLYSQEDASSVPSH